MPHDQHWSPLVPELTVRDLGASLRFYAAVGFRVRFQREAPAFAYLELGHAQLMLEEEREHGQREVPAPDPDGSLRRVSQSLGTRHIA